jgi:chloride channel protein, CIC family
MKPHNFSSVLMFYLRKIRHLSDRHFVLFLSVIVGVLAGLSALALRTGVFYLRELLVMESVFTAKNIFLLLYPAIGIVLVVLMNRFLYRDKFGHSISSLLYSISKRNSYLPRYKPFSSLTGGLLTAGFGGSVGLESPIILSGAGIGSNMARFFRMDYKTTTLLLACGAAGAISAIFNTPVAGVIFALEVLMLDLSRFSLIPLLSASVSGTVTTHIFYKSEILFEFSLQEAFVPAQTPLFILLGIFAGLYSRYFALFYYKVSRFFDGFKSARKKIFFGAVISGLLLFLFPPLYGEGFASVKILFDGNAEQLSENSLFAFVADYPWLLLAFLFVLMFAKAVAASSNIAAGGVGGVFAPALFAGALVGFIFAQSVNMLFPAAELSEQNFTLTGMAAVLAGVIHAPLTGMFLIAEVTSGYELIIPLMISTIFSYITVKIFNRESIFTQELDRRGELITHNKDKAVLRFMRLSKLIEKDFIPVHPEQTLGELTKTVAKSPRHIFPVTDSENNFLGYVSLDDIRELMFDRSMYDVMKVTNLMSVPKAFIEAGDSPETAVLKFKKSGHWNLPVLAKGKYIGFISKSRLFDVYRKLLTDISLD